MTAAPAQSSAAAAGKGIVYSVSVMAPRWLSSVNYYDTWFLSIYFEGYNGDQKSEKGKSIVLKIWIIVIEFQTTFN